MIRRQNPEELWQCPSDGIVNQQQSTGLNLPVLLGLRQPLRDVATSHNLPWDLHCTSQQLYNPCRQENQLPDSKGFARSAFSFSPVLQEHLVHSRVSCGRRIRNNILTSRDCS